MARLARFLHVALAALVVLAAAVWMTPAAAHAGHEAHVRQQGAQSAPAGSAAIEAVAVQPARDAGTADACVLACCAGSATCVAHVAGPPMSSPLLPDPGSAVLLPATAADLPGIPGERLPRPPRAG